MSILVWKYIHYILTPTCLESFLIIYNSIILSSTWNIRNLILKFFKIIYLYYFRGSKHRWHHKDCFDNQISFWNYIFSSVKLSFENCSSQTFMKQNTWTLSLNIKQFGIACFWKYIIVLLFQVSHWNWSTELRQSHVIYR